MQLDLSKYSTQELQRRLRWHENDRGTMTMQEEMRRMYLAQELDAELQRRGVKVH